MTGGKACIHGMQVTAGTAVGYWKDLLGNIPPHIGKSFYGFKK